jgi:hypothetical protein
MSLVERLCLAASIAGMASSCLAQTPVSFNAHTTTSGETPANIYAVDLNNDGITDLVEDTGQSPPGFTVSLGNGDGTFKPAVTYSLPTSGIVGLNQMVTADFNHDGNADLAVLLFSNQIAVYLGKGDGTFEAPKISTISLPSGWRFSTVGGAAAADFNRDGKIDLVAWASSTGSSQADETTAVYVMEGDGTGGFSNPHPVFSGPAEEPGFQVFVGDFDDDGKADIIATDYTLNNEGNVASEPVHVCYGNGDFTFDVATPYTAATDAFLGSGDLNSDGVTDFYVVTGGFQNDQKLGVFYGTASRTFKSYFMDLSNSYVVGTPSDGTTYFSQLALADYNGDGRMDLAAVGRSEVSNTDLVEFFLAGDDPGQFTQQVFEYPVTYAESSPPLAGLFGSSLMNPDLAFNQSPNWGEPPQNKPSYLVAEVNQADSGWFGPCNYPKAGRGFNVCQAGTASGTTATFSAAANSFGKLRTIQLWVDGKKVAEQHHTWDSHAYFDWSGTFSTGTHKAIFLAADIDRTEQTYDFSFTIK